MPIVSASAAKTHFHKLLEHTQRGERFVITKHGRPVAELVPVIRTEPEAVRRTIADIRAFRKTLRKRGVQISDLLKKGESLRDLAHQGHFPR